ncbi:substrate of cAMP-dependent protein kinase (PKA) [Blumeria graminis f. sp. tritici 96224]|uniref:Bgt-5077 n=1 Tax=Blumeria graminis f. sp. tritici 96224 TaxID=1268274 RepID=A0A381LGC5_BLUGR|nr:substrate of cAMP-dependent protein kinase (PKA) [Blumeria graminis f. sp. tritici 96224]
MTDTPSFPLPLDSREQDILENLRHLRDELTLLKQDRSTYIKSADVISIYDRTVEQVHFLNEIRITKPTEQNQVDRMLDCCFQLLSLFFMTIGRNNEAPAAYALTSTIKRLLDHLTEAEIYSAKDLSHISSTLEKLQTVVENSDESHSQNLITLLTNRINLCKNSLSSLKIRLSYLDDELLTVHEKLISILRLLSSANTRKVFSKTEVEKLQYQLREIKKIKKIENFTNPIDKAPRGREEIFFLVEKCSIWADITLERTVILFSKGEIPEGFNTTYLSLVDIRNELAKLSLTQAWSLRETDLYDYQRQLDKIDESRINGNFYSIEGNAADLYVQRTFLYLIRRSYAYIYYLMVASEPVSEGLLPVYNQLQTLRRCLREVKKSGGVGSPRELYPYTMKLDSLDSLRTNGKFLVGNEIPDGQECVNNLLSECCDLRHQLQLEAEKVAERKP